MVNGEEFLAHSPSLGLSGLIAPNVEVLLLNGGECNIKDRWGNTPLSEINGKEGENYSKIRGILSQSLNC